MLITVPEGEDVVAFLAGLGVSGNTWVSGVGTATDVVIAVPGEGASVQRALSGRTQLLSLAGPVAGPLMATLLTLESGQPALTGGQLVGARSAVVSLFLSASVSVSDTLGAAAPAAIGSQGAVAPTGADLDDDEADEAPRFGDRVHHFVFGLCDVMVVREERMKIRDVGGGKLREIHLGAVKVLKPTVEDGRRVFKLGRRK